MSKERTLPLWFLSSVSLYGFGIIAASFIIESMILEKLMIASGSFTLGMLLIMIIVNRHFQLEDELMRRKK